MTQATMLSSVLYDTGLPRPYADSRPRRHEAVAVPAPRPGEVLVKIERASLCHSDLSVVNGSRPRPLPTALGHEAAGASPWSSSVWARWA